MSTMKLSRMGIVVVAATMAACAAPPTDSIEAAHASELAAIEAGVQQYAPAAVIAMTEAKAALDAEMAAQTERMAVTRSYDHAEELAQAYKDMSDKAAQATAEAKVAARAAAAGLIAESRSLLAEIEGKLAAAPVGKGSRADLAALKVDLEAAAAGLTNAEMSLAAEKFLEAQTEAASARQVIDSVGAAIMQAQTIRIG